jgi:pyruvate/2-oxoglutarate dehydrogenase complex dihydrolipoamide acyltransferase (E2) component
MSDHESAHYPAPAALREDPPLDAESTDAQQSVADVVIERLAPMTAAFDRAGDEAGPEPASDAAAAPAERAGAADAHDELSPAVRRLVRQYALDISGVRGTGPAGRIRVGDVIGLVGRGDAARPSAASAEPRAAERAVERSDDEPAYRAEPAALAAPVAAAATTVFECDLTRVLAHRHRLRQDGRGEIAVAAYYVAACRDALSAAPEIAGESGDVARVAVTLASAEGDERTIAVAAGDGGGSLDDRVLALDAALRSPAPGDAAAAALAIHYYAPSGSVLATPTPLAAERTASVGIGRVRRQVVIRADEGESAPRVAALGYVTLTFRPERVTLARANRYLARVVRTLEHWPD